MLISDERSTLSSKSNSGGAARGIAEGEREAAEVLRQIATAPYARAADGRVRVVPAFLPAANADVLRRALELVGQRLADEGDSGEVLSDPARTERDVVVAHGTR